MRNLTNIVEVMKYSMVGAVIKKRLVLNGKLV